MMIGETWLDWETEGRDWPHRSASRFMEVGDLRWHIQEMGPEHAPVLLFLHGTGASCHSWRHVLPVLASLYRVVAVDLPCHGFTQPRGRTDLSLPGMTRSIVQLLQRISVVPAAIIGHSAGAAIAIALAAAIGRGSGPDVIAINGAFLPIRGDRLFSPMAKLLFANPLSASMFSLLARTTPLGGNLLSATGSPIDPDGAALYKRLLTSSGHVRGALGMMAAWDLTRLDALMRGLSGKILLIAARNDPMVPVRNSEHVARHVTGARLVLAEHGGHLLHECNASFVCKAIAEAVKTGRETGADAA